MDERLATDGGWDEALFAKLTPRELEILAAMTTGSSTATIARDLDISRLTVQSHVKNILVKLGVHSKVEAVVMGIRHGIPLDDPASEEAFSGP
jgi:two-component system, NarL family, nitrate/nitrite response regulator NarL